MAGAKTNFDEFLAREVERGRLYFPVRTGILRRLLIRRACCADLHPNPEDEFSMPGIGPNYEIISRYQKQFVDALCTSREYLAGDPVIVERMHPDGYRIVNGHHRWAAAMRIGQKRIPIEIVNLMHEADVKRILANSKHTKRAALDLDEVVFREDGPLEEALPFPWSRLYRERVPLGVPALFHFLKKNGYDIWLYSSKYYSEDHIRRFFRMHHVGVDGVMTAIGKRGKAAGQAGNSLEKMITDKYRFTLHIDREAVLQILGGTEGFREFPLSGDASGWPKEVMAAVETIEKADREDPSR